ncbi:MAG: DUF3606 domain-containing protein [Bacteroidetes bacterium]|nr:DUF3606 domain-containing protein [Bacteroidota bacterium]
MLFNLHDNQVIYPCERKQINFWAKKWGIRAQELNEAILETGSIKRKVLKSYLEKKGILFSVSGSLRKLKSQIQMMADKLIEEEEE